MPTAAGDSVMAPSPFRTLTRYRQHPEVSRVALRRAGDAHDQFALRRILDEVAEEGGVGLEALEDRFGRGRWRRGRGEDHRRRHRDAVRLGLLLQRLGVEGA